MYAVGVIIDGDTIGSKIKRLNKLKQLPRISGHLHLLQFFQCEKSVSIQVAIKVFWEDTCSHGYENMPPKGFRVGRMGPLLKWKKEWTLTRKKDVLQARWVKQDTKINSTFYLVLILDQLDI